MLGEVHASRTLPIHERTGDRRATASLCFIRGPLHDGATELRTFRQPLLYSFFRTSFHSLATFALRGVSPLAGSGTITA